jgi:hypothetical protein
MQLPNGRTPSPLNSKSFQGLRMAKCSVLTNVLPLFRSLALFAVGSLVLSTSGCESARHTTLPGEYQFVPVWPSGNPRVLAHFNAFGDRAIHVGAEWFSDRSPSSILAYIESIAFKHNYNAEDELFWGLSAGHDGFYIRYHASGSADTGRVKSSEGWTVRGDDPLVRRMFELLFEYLIKGIAQGRWVPDPNLADPNAVGGFDVSPICELVVGLHPGYASANVARDDEGAVKLGLESGKIIVGVYYDVIHYNDYIEPGDAFGIPFRVPHVFLFGNRTTTHIYLLDHEWGRKFHTMAGKLYERLDDIVKELEAEEQAPNNRDNEQPE